jgi:hypothetical protein
MKTICADFSDCLSTSTRACTAGLRPKPTCSNIFASAHLRFKVFASDGDLACGDVNHDCFPYSFNAQRLFTKRISSTLLHGTSSRRGLANTNERTCAREIATLMRLRLNRKSTPRGISGNGLLPQALTSPLRLPIRSQDVYPSPQERTQVASEVSDPSGF